MSKCLSAGVRRAREEVEPPSGPVVKAPRVADPPQASAAASVLEHLLTVHGPPDFGGRIAELLWGVHFEYSAPVEYLLLLFRPSEEQRKQQLGARRVERPELHMLLRCSHAVRLGTIAAARARSCTIEPGASATERSTFDDICKSLRRKYPESWAAVRGCCGPKAIAA